MSEQHRRTTPGVDRDRARVRQFVNKSVTVQSLLKTHFNIDVRVGETLRCPFHDDNRKSAKLFADAMFCYACRVQYTPYRFLRELGQDLDKILPMIPPDFIEEPEKKFDIHVLDPHVAAAKKIWAETRSPEKLTGYWLEALKALGNQPVQNVGGTDGGVNLRT